MVVIVGEMLIFYYLCFTVLRISCFSFLLTRKNFLLWRVNIYSIDFTDLVTWQKM